eukprot:15463586-Alexandrium_andersonii.AAC.1
MLFGAVLGASELSTHREVNIVACPFGNGERGHERQRHGTNQNVLPAGHLSRAMRSTRRGGLRCSSE